MKIASSIAKNNNIAEDMLKNSRPKSLKEFENLFEISEPKSAPNDPPAIIIP
tara:strand:+ start:47 stop:202 length:156 start_codon:yes stop_codon:yes gene_type:complete